ncbi:CaiB/BaiF CoA-transferase family protein [Nocardioides sp. 31GB23]|uniref:CaiB/BaiF CoA transferase family protein n=1 Tax=Nocardioides sp. 31GB23 TaxID=3156065 RepID=UPI0032AF2BCC
MMIPGALDGVRILDLTRHMSGPYGTAMLSDYGASVVKVESAASGDPSRSTGHAYHGTENALYLMWNRGKRSIALNLREPEAIDIVRRLAAESDIFVENYRPGVAESMGLGYEDLKVINPRLIYISVSGFGRGPLEAWPATDPVVQAMSGVMSVTGEIDGGPVLIGVPIADYAGAMQVIQSSLLGLIARGRTGEGQYIEVSMLHALMAALTTRLALYWATGEEPERLGGAHSAVAPYNVFETKDGYMVAGVWGAGEAWPKFCDALGRPDLVDDPRFTDNKLRVGNRHLLVPIIESITRTQPTAVWEERFRAVHVLFGPVLDFPSLLSHEHVKAAGIVSSVEHPGVGSIPQLSPTLKMSGTPGHLGTPPPMLGEHTREILTELDYAAADVERLLAGGVARSNVVGAPSGDDDVVPPQ